MSASDRTRGSRNSLGKRGLPRRFIAGLALSGLILTACGADGVTNESVEPVTLDVGLFGALSDAGLIIAQERGYFEDELITVEFVSFRAAPQIISLLAAGEVAAAGIAPTPGFFNAIADGVNIRIAADKGQIGPEHSWVSLVVRSDLYESGEITEVSDLEGKTVGLTGLETSTGAELNEVLVQNGLSIDDVDLQDGGPADNLTALANEAIEAAALQEPFVTLSVVQGVGQLLSPFGEAVPNGQNGVLAFGEALVEDEDLSERFLRAYLRGVADYNAAFPPDGSEPEGRDEVVGLLVANTPVENPDLYEQMAPVLLSADGSPDTASIDLFQQFFIDRGLQHEFIPSSDYLLP